MKKTNNIPATMEQKNNIPATMEQKNNIPATMEQKDYVVRFEVITPERAKQILEENPLNRKVKNYSIRFLLNQIQRGEWNPSPSQPIVFAADGTLLDGQHRLIACIKSSKALPMYVIYNVPKECRSTIDTGVTRSGYDILAMEGIPSAAIIAAIILEYLSLINIGFTATGAKFALVSNKDILNEYMSDMDGYQTIQRLAASIYSKGRYLTTKQIGGISAFLLKEKGHSMEEISGFFLELASGGKHECIAWLRNRLALSNASANRQFRLSSNEKMILVSKAWNTYISGKDAHSFHLRKSDSIAFI